MPQHPPGQVPEWQVEHQERVLCPHHRVEDLAQPFADELARILRPSCGPSPANDAGIGVQPHNRVAHGLTVSAQPGIASNEPWTFTDKHCCVNLGDSNVFRQVHFPTRIFRSHIGHIVILDQASPGSR